MTFDIAGRGCLYCGSARRVCYYAVRASRKLATLRDQEVVWRKKFTNDRSLIIEFTMFPELRVSGIVYPVRFCMLRTYKSAPRTFVFHISRDSEQLARSIDN